MNRARRWRGGGQPLGVLSSKPALSAKQQAAYQDDGSLRQHVFEYEHCTVEADDRWCRKMLRGQVGLNPRLVLWSLFVDPVLRADHGTFADYRNAPVVNGRDLFLKRRRSERFFMQPTASYLGALACATATQALRIEGTEETARPSLGRSPCACRRKMARPLRVRPRRSMADQEWAPATRRCLSPPSESAERQTFIEKRRTSEAARTRPSVEPSMNSGPVRRSRKEGNPLVRVPPKGSRMVPWPSKCTAT